nr:hypothetical protein [Tanacetum cinerariifolium]
MYNKFRDAFHRLFEADERTFKTVLSRNMQNLERQLNKEKLHEKDSNSDLRMIKVASERLNERKLQIQGCTFQEVKALDATLEDNTKKRCMVSLRQLHSHLKRLSQNNLQGSRIESGFKQAFVTIFGQDLETFTGTIFLNLEQLEKQLDKEDFQEIGSMVAFNVLETQFQMFITSRHYLDDEYVAMTHSYFQQYTQHAILEFCDTLIQHFVSVKKLIDERTQHKRDLVKKESSGIESKEQDTSSRSGNDAHDDGQQSQFLKEKSNEAKVKHDIDAIQTLNIKLEYKVAKLLKENETLKKNYNELFDSIKITSNKTIEHTTSLIALNDNFKAQLQEKGFAIAALKNELRILKGNGVNTKFVKQSVLGKPMLQSHKNQSVVRQPTAFKSERPRILEPRFASQVDVYNDLSKLLTTHYLPKEREASSAKPHYMIVCSNSRISSKNMP